MENNKRIYFLDVLRVISCLAVIMIHASAEYVVRDIGTINFWIGNIFDGISAIAVPIFIMISGTLLLDEKYLYTKKKLIKHISKMILFFVFWSLVYCIIYKIIWPIFIGGGVILLAL